MPHSVVVECDGWTKVFEVSNSNYNQGRFDIMMSSALSACYLPPDVIPQVCIPTKMTAWRTTRSVNNMTIFEVRE